MRNLVIASIALGTLQSFTNSPALASLSAQRTYTANEAYLISSLSYQSSAARAALSRQFDSKISAQQSLIDTKDAALKKLRRLLKESMADTSTANAEIEMLEQELTRLKSEFLAQLSQKDLDFARERAELEEDAQNLLRTPAGQEAMAVYLSSEPGAVKAGLLLFDQIATSRNEADKRRVAMLAYDSFQKGELTTLEILTRLEDVAPPENRTHNDWFFLSKIYSRLVRHDDARNAAQNALKTAQTDGDRLDAYDRLADALLELEDFEGALAQSQLAQGLAFQWLAVEPQNFHFRRSYASILSTVGDAYLKIRDRDLALSYFVESAKIIRMLNDEYPNQPVLWSHIVSDSSRIGNFLYDRKDFDGALSHFQYALYFANLGKNATPNNINSLDSVAYSHRRIGDVLLEMSDLTGALSEYEASHAIEVELNRRDPSAYDPQEGLASSFLRLGEVRAKQKNFVGALADYERGAEIIRALTKQDSISRDKLRSLAVAVGRVGNMRSQIGMKKEAAASYKEALGIYKNLVELDPTSFEDQVGIRIFLSKLANERARGFTWKMVLEHMEMMDKLGMIKGDDVEYMIKVREYADDQ
jgi:tetratricopeptide (TPR) repeat protein